MAPSEAFKLLLLHDSESEANRLISMLNNAGRPNRAQYVASLEGMQKLLEEQNWDLLIAHEKSQSPTLEDAIKLIRRLNKDVATISLADEPENISVIQGMKAGAIDVVVVDNDQHLLLVIDRELQNRDHRRSRRNADRKYRESERRCQSLLDSSRDAIAYVQDGLLSYVNESFAEQFNYQEKDDLEFLPIIDLVAEKDQDTVKDFLKNYRLRGDDAETTELHFKAIQESGDRFNARVQVSNAIYEEEPCLQFTIHATSTKEQAQLAEQLREANQLDSLTGLYNSQYIRDLTGKLINSASQNSTNHALFYLEMNDYDIVKADIGAVESEQLVSALAKRLASNVEKNSQQIGRFSDNSYLIVSKDCSASEASNQAEKLVKSIANEPLDFAGRSRQIAITIGIALINEVSESTEASIKQAHTAFDQAQKAGNSTTIYEPPTSNDPNSTEYVIKRIQESLSEGKLQLLYQPIMSLRGDDAEHYEVLLRLEGEPEIDSETLFTTAANYGQSNKLDQWVIIQATKVLAKHRAAGNNTRLLIHLTLASMKDTKFVQWVSVVFKAAGLPANSVIFELPEHMVVDHVKDANQIIDGIQELGSTACISHFGCSPNALKVLDNVNPNLIKVDGSFTIDIQHNNESPEALGQLINELQDRNKRVIVPFVENPTVLSTLWQAGAHYIQGYFLQEPSPEMDYNFDMES